MPITDLTRGEYRKIYAGWIRGKRINSVPYEAEPTFLRVNLIADSFGNFPADMDLLRAQAFVRRRELEDDVIANHLGKLAEKGLIRFYEIDGDRYGHIVGFRLLQPAGKNGKPFRRCPKPPFDDSEKESLGESKHAQDNPDASKIIQTPKRTRTRKRTGTGKEQKGGISKQRDSGSDSFWDRNMAKLQLDIAVTGIIGLEDGCKHPRKSPKWNTDTTMKDNWLADIIWPDGSDPDEARARLQIIIDLVPKAAKNGKNPMAYLNTVIKRTFKEAVA